VSESVPQDVAVPAALAPPSTPVHRLLTPSLRWLVVAGLFASYPIALLIPMGMGVSLAFHIAAPLFTVLTLSAVAYLAITPLRGHGERAALRRLGVLAVLWLYVALHLAAAVAGRSADLFRIAETAGLVVLTALFAFGPTHLLPRRLDLVLLWLWCAQVVHCGFQALAGYEPVALAGNRNWAATLVAVLAPWACFALRRLGGPRRGMSAPLGRIVLQGMVIAVSLVIVYACHCRATWLALGLYGVLVFMLKPASWPGRVLLLTALTLVALGAVISYPEAIGRAIERDIRLPLYANTGRMIADHPWLGVGPGNFARDFVPYRSLAQKARAVAAPVSDHPHCEVLNVGATIGVPGALLWVLVLVVPLLLSPGSSPYRRLAHASLWLLVIHGLLDKPLVQPPTNLLAAIFAGVLWRPRLRLRVEPRRRPAFLALLRLPVAAVVVVLSLYVSVRDLWQGALFRRAYLAEAEGQYYEDQHEPDQARAAYLRAYDDYVLSTRVGPRNVRSYAYAGVCANNKLHDPELALPHIRHAMAIEPDFAHLNGEAGLALGTLGRHDEAFAFFAREAQIFPFDIEPLQRLLLCAAATNRLDLLTPLHERLMAASARKASLALGESTARGLALSLAVALENQRPAEALAAANALAQPLESHAVEPALYGTLDKRLIDSLRRAPFGALDVTYWNDLVAARRGWLATPSHEPASLLSLLRRGGTTSPEALAAGLDVARVAGYSPAFLCLSQAAERVRFVQLSRDAKCWLLDLDRGQVLDGTGFSSLYTQATLRETCGLREEDLKDGVAVIPANPLQFFYRTQALGAMVRQISAAAGAPLAVSPMVEAANLQLLLARDFEAASLPPGTLRVAYDQARLQALAAAVRTEMESPAHPAAPAPR
jgi:O-antigen ligase/tetratricopeptide (TPR) repeat protein